MPPSCTSSNLPCSNSRTSSACSNRLISSSMRWSLSAAAVLRACLRDVVPVPEAAALRDPPLRRVVHPHDPEALAVPVLPFEVVEQRPREVALDVDAVLDRSRER